ncbi:MAG: sulfatase-like hydrolase/transferase [Bacteroidia bacterium]|nr:sulfatase-like hydrolase/transferase [Bacteroidia bacterium]
MKHIQFNKSLIAVSVFSALSGLNSHGSEAHSGKPNILFFFPDQFRYDWTSMNPVMPNITPNLKDLAHNGVYFSSAICPSPLCAPSRACLASGKQYERCRVPSNGTAFPLDETTFYKLLRDSAGYHVLGCGKFDLDKPGNNWGIDGKHHREGFPSLLNVWGFTDGIDNAGKSDGINSNKNNIPEPYYAYLKDHGLTLQSMTDEAYADNWIARNGLELLRAVPVGEPWFLQINFNGPHSPYDPTPAMLKGWDTVHFPSAVDNTRDVNELRQMYSAEIFNIDRWIKVYLDELQRRGELDNTIIVFCSDHGDMLGDHGLEGKSKPYHPSVGVPLVISGHGIKKNLINTKPVTTLDLTATFLDFAKIKEPSGMDSKSLRSYLETGKGYNRKYVTSALGAWRMVFDGRYKLIDTKNAPIIIYDLEKDPSETINVAAGNRVNARRNKKLTDYLQISKGY